jgi:hypothetical protein
MLELTTPPLTQKNFLEAIPAMLDIAIQSNAPKFWVMYGWASNLSNEELWQETEVSPAQLLPFIQSSIEKGIFRPSSSDLHIRNENETLNLMFCHEEDIHLTAESPEIRDQFKAYWSERGVKIYHQYTGRKWLRRQRKKRSRVLHKQILAEEFVSPETALSIVLDGTQPMDRRRRCSMVVQKPLDTRSIRDVLELLSTTKAESEPSVIARLLCEPRCRAATKSLLKLAEHGQSEDIQYAALHVLGRTHDRRSIRALIRMATDQNRTEFMRSVAAEALLQFHLDPLPVLQP